MRLYTEMAVITGARSRGTETVSFPDLSCTPAYPADPGKLGALLQENIIKSMYNVFDVFVNGLPATREGDTLALNEISYLIRAVAPWRSTHCNFTHLTVEQIKQ